MCIRDSVRDGRSHCQDRGRSTAGLRRSIQIAEPVINTTRMNIPTSVAFGIPELAIAGAAETVGSKSMQKATEPVSLDETRKAVTMSPENLNDRFVASLATRKPAVVKLDTMLAVSPAAVLLGDTVVSNVRVNVP